MKIKLGEYINYKGERRVIRRVKGDVVYVDAYINSSMVSITMSEHGILRLIRDGSYIRAKHGFKILKRVI